MLVLVLDSVYFGSVLDISFSVFLPVLDYGGGGVLGIIELLIDYYLFVNYTLFESCLGSYLVFLFIRLSKKWSSGS